MVIGMVDWTDETISEQSTLMVRRPDPGASRRTSYAYPAERGTVLGTARRSSPALVLDRWFMMSEGVEFDDEDVIAGLEQLYQTPSMVERRRLVRDALALSPGEAVLSVGTGPGFEARGLAEAVGDTGHVHGLDNEQAMLAVARDRCADQPWVTFEQGDAVDLPMDTGTFDAAVAVQVYEYVPDLNAALGELYRVLRPGGRAVVFDSDWGTLTWHAADEARNARMISAFDAHCPHPRLARTLKPRLEQADFQVTRQDVYVHFETEFDEDRSISAGLLPLVRDFLVLQANLDTAEVDAWVDDVHRRAAAGEYFFSFNQYLFLVEKSGADQ